MAASKKKKKNAVTLIVLVVALAVLVVAYVAASNWKSAKEEKEAQENAKDTSVVIATINPEELVSISVVSDLYEFTLLQDSGWSVAGEEDFPLNASKADQMADTLESLVATKLLIADAPDLSEYGLAEPVLKVTAALADGSQKTILIGDKSSADGGYYTCMAGSNDVYLISATNREVFYQKETDLISRDTVPIFDPNLATGMKVESDKYTEFSILDSQEDFDWTDMNFYPNSLYGIYAMPVHIDVTNFATLMEDYSYISLGDLVSYRTSDLEKYGLDMPKTALTVFYTEEEEGEEKEFTIYFGNQTEDGSHWYVRLADSSQVFEMDYETADGLLDVDTFSLISKFVVMVNIKIVDAMHLSYGDTNREFELSHTTEIESDGTETIEDFITVDGKSLDTEEEVDLFRDIYQKILGIRLTGKLEEELAVVDQTVFSVEFESGERSYVVKCLPIEGVEDTYAIEVNGVRAFTADAAAVDELVDLVREYQP